MGQWTWYAVQNGRQPGLYRTWDQCAAQVKGFPNARFKGFKTREGAEGYVRGGNGVSGGSRAVGMAALGGVSSSAPPRTSVNGLSISATMSSSSRKPGSSVPSRTMNGLSMTAAPSSSSPRPGSSAPVRGMIGISAEVMASLLNLQPSTPAGSINELSTAENTSSSTPKMTVNGLSAALNTSPSTPRMTINGLSTTPNTSSSTPAKSIDDPPTAPKPPSPVPERPAHHPLSAAAAALSSLPASSPSSKFYAVATGRKPGVYLTWRECEEQVRGVSGARYKSFGGRAEAVEFLAVYGGGGHFSQFEGEGFTPDRGASFSDEFGRLSSSQGWAPGSQRYNRERARALRNELQTHYFSSAPVAVKEEDAEGEADDKSLAAVNEEMDEAAEPLVAIKKEEEEEDEDEGLVAVREQLASLQGFQNLCREIGKEPADTVGRCKRILRNTLVNIVDLIDARRIGAKVEEWTDFKAFEDYTLDEDLDRTIPVEFAKQDPLLKCFLKHLTKRRRHTGFRAGRPSRKRLLSMDYGSDSKRRRVDWYEG